MKMIRLAVLGITLLLCLGGYLASQYSFFQGTTGAYIKALDSSPVPILSLVLLIALVILAFLPERSEE
jgi:hypothetical protein